MEMPEDVVFNILIHLPVISLLRFKSVCKLWHALINNSNFISQHHHRQNSSLVVRYLRDWNDRGSFLSHSAHHNFELPCYLDLPPEYRKLKDHPNSVKLVASCNGIICLSDETFPGDLSKDSDITLWNPATKELRALPEPLLRYPPNPLDRSVLSFVSFGFGFDANTNDYKVVRIIVFQENGKMTEILVEVDSLSTNSWRIIDRVGLLPVDYILFHPQSPYNNIIYCWFGATFDRIKHLSLHSIISFDFSEEVFKAIPMPDICSSVDSFQHQDYIQCLRLGFVNEDLACILLVGDPIGDDDCHFEIWVLTEFGVTYSWTKKYMISARFTASAFPIVIGFYSYGEVLLVVLDGSLCLCDPVTREVKDLQIRNISNSLQIAPYKESLVSIR